MTPERRAELAQALEYAIGSLQDDADVRASQVLADYATMLKGCVLIDRSYLDQLERADCIVRQILDSPREHHLRCETYRDGIRNCENTGTSPCVSCSLIEYQRMQEKEGK